MNKTFTIYKFPVILLAICLFNSCIEKEEAESSLRGTVEFVLRQTGYNDKNVNTKATIVDDFENQIHCCYFLLYNSQGNLVYGPVDLNATLSPQRMTKNELQEKLGNSTNCTACYVANVPEEFVNTGLETISKLNSAVLDITYAKKEVIDNNNKTCFFVVPDFVLKDGEEQVQCIPMFGMADCNIANSDVFEVSLKRLFSKVSVEISTKDRSMTSIAYTFDLYGVHLNNLPTKVKLTEPTSSTFESTWVKDEKSFLLQNIEGPIDDDNISTLTQSKYQFYFYVPEYYVQPLPEKERPKELYFGLQQYKPKMVDSNKYPLLLRLFGYYNESATESNKKSVTYDLYLGENASTDFILKRNTYYDTKVKINGLTKNNEGTADDGTLDCRVDISSLNEIDIIGQTANCYILNKVGTYIYPACKGVFKDGFKNIPENLKCKEGTTLEILQTDNESIKLENLAFDPESCEISFKVSSLGSSSLSSKDGNIIIGLTYDDNGTKKTEWSWHLWFVDEAIFGINLNAFDISTDTYPNGKIVMDRNLGAKKESSISTQSYFVGGAPGLYYKYGCKDPFINNTWIVGGDTDVKKWGANKKSQTDPCPPGYRVPEVTTWQTTGVNGENYDFEIAGYGDNYFKYNTGTYMPYTGHLNASNSKVSKLIDPYTHNGSYANEMELTGYKIRNTTYTIQINRNLYGSIHGADEKVFTYEAMATSTLGDATIKSCEIYKYVLFQGYKWSTASKAELRLINALGVEIKNKLNDSDPNLKKQLVVMSHKYTNANFGYQVRCVKE